jgi:propionyl-CoA carboxylase alpha chain
MEGRRRTYRVHADGAVFDVDGPTGHVRLTERDRFPRATAAHDAGSLHAPMPGKVLQVLVTEGDTVTEGQSLLVMEAMKMEHTLRAPVSGTVESVKATAGDQVEADAALVVIREEES